jgi:hypothetical protein
MSQLGRLHRIATNPATQFISAIAQNAGEYLGLSATELGITAKGRVARVVLRTIENKDWEVYFYATSANNTALPSTNKYLGRCAFVAADGKQIAATGPYLYDKACDVPVEDAGGASKIHVVLVNRGTLTTAGADRIGLELHVDPTHGD